MASVEEMDRAHDWLVNNKSKKQYVIDILLKFLLQDDEGMEGFSDFLISEGKIDDDQDEALGDSERRDHPSLTASERNEGGI